jgi:4-hydroxybenzoate polyprenyltransferase
VLHAIAVLFLLLAGLLLPFGIIYWTGITAFTAMLVYQHLLVKPYDLSKVNIAFFTTNGIASIIFAGFTITDLVINRSI